MAAALNPSWEGGAVLHWSCDHTTLVMWLHYTGHVTTLHWSCDYTTLVMWLHYTGHVTTLHLPCDYTTLIMWLHYTYHVITLHLPCDHTTLHMWLHYTGHVTHTTHVVMYCLRELVLHVIFLLAMAIFCDRVGSNRLSLAIFRMEWSDLGVPGRAGSFCRLVLNASSNSEKSSSSRMVSSSSWVKTVPAICVGGRLTQFNNGSRYLVSIFLFIG